VEVWLGKGKTRLDQTRPPRELLRMGCETEYTSGRSMGRHKRLLARVRYF
jgi:hypothetical protein